MKYLTGFITEEEILKRNNEIALGQGAGNNPHDVTKYWYGTIKHPERNEWVMEINDNYIYKLTDKEISELKEYHELDDDGWFE